jgi:methylenetetrahydrofolate reductase (NADPH)
MERLQQKLANEILTPNNTIKASIEVSPKQALDDAALSDLFPAGTSVYITDIGTDSPETLANAAQSVKSHGYDPVPHFASRRIPSMEILEERLKRFQEIGVEDCLVIGGGLEEPAGPFTSSNEVLESGLFDKYGIKRIGIAGHPEGSPDFSEEVAIEALRLKKAFGERSDAKLRIVTQFGFDSEGFVSWADGLREHGIDLPVHLGVAGPAKLTTLIKFAAMCGVGNSISFLKKRTSAITTLATGFKPDTIVNPIENHVKTNLDSDTPSAIRQIHVFPFGGVKNSANWLYERGTWGKSDTQRQAC